MKKVFSVLLITVILTAALCSTSFAGRALSNGMSGDDVYTLQQLLAFYGYFYEEPTGYFGDITENAVAAFQRDAGLWPDGIAGESTCYYLGLITNTESYEYEESYSEPAYFDYVTNVLTAAQWTPSAGAGYCAAWVTGVLKNAGVLNYDIHSLRPTFYSYSTTSGLDGGAYDTGFNANDFWAYVCYSDNIYDLQPGMVIATRSSNSYMGSLYGHVGIYIGDGLVVSSIGYLETLPVYEWIAKYNNAALGSTARWGYLPHYY